MMGTTGTYIIGFLLYWSTVSVSLLGNVLLELSSGNGLLVHFIFIVRFGGSVDLPGEKEDQVP